jgi:hypothetical protein
MRTIVSRATDCQAWDACYARRARADGHASPGSPHESFCLRTPPNSFGASSFDRLLAMYRAGPDELRAFVGPGPLLTDDRPLVEYFLSLPRDREVDLSTLRGDVRRFVPEE